MRSLRPAHAVAILSLSSLGLFLAVGSTEEPAPALVAAPQPVSTAVAGSSSSEVESAVDRRESMPRVTPPVEVADDARPAVVESSGIDRLPRDLLGRAEPDLDDLVAQAGGGAWTILVEAFGHDDPAVRSRALGHLVRLDPVAALEHIECGLADPSARVRRRALRSLGQVPDHGALEIALRTRVAEGDGEALRAQAVALDRLRSVDEESARNGLEALAGRADVDPVDRTAWLDRVAAR